MEKIDKKPAQKIIIAAIERWVKQADAKETKGNSEAIDTLCLLITVLCGILKKIIITPEEDLLKVIENLKMIQSLPECAILLKNWRDRKLQNPIQQTIEGLEESVPVLSI